MLLHLTVCWILDSNSSRNRSELKERKKKIVNIDRFVKKFGVDPATACQIYEWMQRTEIDEARLVGNDRDFKFFLIAL